MMSENMMSQMPNAAQGGMIGMMNHPVAKGAMIAATGYAASKTLLGPSLLRNPLLLIAGGIAGGVALGYLLHKHEKDVVRTVSKIVGMGRDFAMQQREHLDDLIAEAQAGDAAPAAEPSAGTPAADTPA